MEQGSVHGREPGLGDRRGGLGFESIPDELLHRIPVPGHQMALSFPTAPAPWPAVRVHDGGFPTRVAKEPLRAPGRSQVRLEPIDEPVGLAPHWIPREGPPLVRHELDHTLQVSFKTSELGIGRREPTQAVPDRAPHRHVGGE